MIYIASDHGGFERKQELAQFLHANGFEFSDLGPMQLDPKDDYPKYSAKVAKAVQKNPNKYFGILLCRSGQGVCIVANKFKGVRAALAWNEQLAKAARNDDNANVLCLPSDYISAEAACETAKVFLQTAFSGEERHVRRLQEIEGLNN